MKENFKVKEIYSEGYERWIKAWSNRYKTIYWLHFIEFDEYIQNPEVTNLLSIGDTVTGALKIGLVTEYKVLKGIPKVGFIQSIEKSSSIKAFGMVKQIEDDATVICSIDKLGEYIMIEFEKNINLRIGELIEVNGSLELERE